jgi:hypothetical protein
MRRPEKGNLSCSGCGPGLARASARDLEMTRAGFRSAGYRQKPYSYELLSARLDQACDPTRREVKPSEDFRAYLDRRTVQFQRHFLMLSPSRTFLEGYTALTDLCRLAKGFGAVFPNFEVHQLHAVIVLAEELNFTRAADKLHISQPTLSRKITGLEEQHRACHVGQVRLEAQPGRSLGRRRVQLHR